MSKVTEKKERAIRGFVVSDKMDKTRVAKIERMVKHPVVGKYVRRSTKFMFHDEKNETRIGDEVTITPVRPMSAHKSYKLVEILRKAID